MGNHLGNVLEVVSDRKLAVNDGFGNVEYYTADVVVQNDYYPFGMLLPNRHSNTPEYRYGFQGQEMDDEIKGEGNSINFTFRMHDPRIGRFFRTDPLTGEYPYNSPYIFCENNLIAFIDLEGLEKYYSSEGIFLGQFGNSSELRVMDDLDQYWISEKQVKTYLQSNKATAANLLNQYSSKTTYKRLLSNQKLYGHHEQMVDLTIGEYNLEDISQNYIFEVDNTVRLGTWTTQGQEGGVLDETQLIKASESTVEYLDHWSKKSGAVIALAHEFIHVYQRTEMGMTDKSEREFLAHHFSIFPNSSVLQMRAETDPNISEQDIAVFTMASYSNRSSWIKEAETRYSELNPMKKEVYKGLYQEVIDEKAKMVSAGTYVP